MLCKEKYRQSGWSNEKMWRRIRLLTGLPLNPVENIKTIGKTNKNKRTKEVRTRLAKNFEKTENKQNTTFRPLSGLGDIGLNMFLFVFLFSFFRGYCKFSLDLFGSFVVFGFPYGF